jgi:hypothetical protein
LNEKDGGQLDGGKDEIPFRVSVLKNLRKPNLEVVFNTTRKDPDILVVPIVTVFVPKVTKCT